MSYTCKQPSYWLSDKTQLLFIDFFFKVLILIYFNAKASSHSLFIWCWQMTVNISFHFLLVAPCMLLVGRSLIPWMNTSYLLAYSQVTRWANHEHFKLFFFRQRFLAHFLHKFARKENSGVTWGLTSAFFMDLTALHLCVIWVLLIKCDHVFGGTWWTVSGHWLQEWPP